MQKCFIVRNGKNDVRESDLKEVNTFLGDRGKVISVISCKPIDVNQEFGSWFIVAEDGKNTNPLD